MPLSPGPLSTISISSQGPDTKTGQWTVGCVIGIAVQERWQDKGHRESQGFQLSVHSAHTTSVTCPDN